MVCAPNAYEATVTKERLSPIFGLKVAFFSLKWSTSNAKLNVCHFKTRNIPVCFTTSWSDKLKLFRNANVSSLLMTFLMGTILQLYSAPAFQLDLK